MRTWDNKRASSEGGCIARGEKRWIEEMLCTRELCSSLLADLQWIGQTKNAFVCASWSLTGRTQSKHTHHTHTHTCTMSGIREKEWEKVQIQVWPSWHLRTHAQNNRNSDTCSHAHTHAHMHDWHTGTNSQHTHTQAFSSWMNSYLNKQNSNVQDISRDLSDGVKLIQFLELLSGTQAPFKYHAKVSLCMCVVVVSVFRWGCIVCTWSRCGWHCHCHHYCYCQCYPQCRWRCIWHLYIFITVFSLTVGFIALKMFTKH